MATNINDTSMAQATTKGQEPAMYLQRPSTGRSQDIRHILTQVFRDLYTREAIRPETVKNLQVSKCGDDPYHERYVESLQNVYNEWTRRMDEVTMLERHIMQAQARALSADERDIHCPAIKLEGLGLPPGRAHFKSCIDTQLLRAHNLLTPEDYSTKEPVSVPLPSAPAIPSYTRKTVSSQQRSRESEEESQSPHPLQLKQEESLEFPFSMTGTYSADSNQLAVEKTAKTAKEEKFPSAQAWKSYISTEQRQADRNDLAKMDAKVNYLRNPRYLPPSASGNKTLIRMTKPKAKQINILPKAEKVLEEEAPIFIASPPEVVFRNYKVGHVYEIILELKNVSTVMRQCRAFPPKSSYFSVGLGQFPGEKGLVAPGMSCHYPIRFAPDSLKDYDDEIIIQTLTSNQMVVNIKGRREPPCLTIPPELDVGYCLIKGFQITQFIFQNEGGPGRFCIMPRSLWPATNFRNASVMLIPFEIRPSLLELDHGQVAMFEVMFRPSVTRVYTQDFSILCDNCHIRHFSLKGEGQIVSLILSRVEGGEALALPGELCDRSAQHLIKFDDLNPFTFTERSISVQNLNDVELPFQWMVYKPQMPREKPRPLDDFVDEAPPFQGPVHDPEEDRVPELDSVFSVYPHSGILRPRETTDFKITFAPPVINAFHNVIHLLIQQVPTCENNDELAEFVPREGAVLSFHDLTTLEIEVKGHSIPLNVVLHPYAIYLPGSYLTGNTIKRMFTMANHSLSTITFQWEPVHNSEMILEVEPPFGELDAGMAMDLELSVTGTEPGHINHTLYCYVLNLKEPLHLHIETTIKGPEVVVEEPSINFGLIRLGDTVEREITLTSMAQFITKWSLQYKALESPAEVEDDKDFSEFKFFPESGELLPLEQKKVTVQFTPKDVKTVKSTAVLQIENGNTVSVGIFAEVQHPVVCLLECDVNLPEVYVGVPVVFQTIIYNQTLLPTTFEWGKAEGLDADDCAVDIAEPAGELLSREKHKVQISFCAFRPGDFSEVILPCSVREQDFLLFLNISCTVGSLSVHYKTSDDEVHQSGQTISIDFGEDVQLGKPVKRYLYICNETAITANFNLMMEVFSVAHLPRPLQEIPKDLQRDTNSARSRLTCTPDLADPLSKTQAKLAADFKLAVLGKDLGAAFLLQPSCGTLLPFENREIEVTAYSDMWGKYNDIIVCKVGDLAPVTIPVSMTVKGCPLNFQMTAANPNQPTIIRYGTLVAGTVPVSRQVRINNTSPCDIRIDWKVYNKKKNDEKLVDLVVVYGRPFPPPDIQKAETKPGSTQRYQGLIEKIPDSPSPLSTPNSVQYTCSCSSLPFSPDNSSDNIQEENPKIVSLFLRSHDGVEEYVPYSIQPQQLTIPGKGHATVYITFTPPQAEDVTQEIDCISYALGFLSLDSESANMPGMVERPEAFETQQLRIDHTARVKPALLTVEETDDEGMHFQAATSDIFDGDKVKPESLCIRSLMLSNSTQTPMSFRLKVAAPFTLIGLDGSSGDGKAMETDLHVLQPQHNIMVKVALQITSTFISDYKLARGTEDWDWVTRDNRLIISDHLIIEFNNNTCQKIALKASVAIGELKLSKTKLDFGTCLVGQRRELQLLISNTAAAHCSWVASFVQMSSTCVQDTFQISPTHGLLDAYITHVSKSKSLLSIFFTAKHAEPYDAAILFRGLLGETQQWLNVRGQGSYDGKYEAVLNI